MDPLKLNTYRMAAEIAFCKLKRTAFQEWLGNIMLRRFPDEFRELRSKQGKYEVGFERFVLTLDMLFLFEAVDIDRGRIVRRNAA